MFHRPLPLLIAGLLVTLAPPANAGPAPQAASTVRVSVDNNEQQFDTYHDNPAISANGRYVAFSQGIFSVYVRDRTGGSTELVSNAASFPNPDLSADGNLVVFEVFDNLIVFNRSTDVEEVVFPVTGCACEGPSMSASGALIAFDSSDPDLVAGDTNGLRDVFFRDRAAGTTERISLSSSDKQANAPSSQAAVSANGRYVVFRSDASNLVPGDTNGKADVFVRDRQAGTTQRVSVDSAETQGNDFSDSPDVSNDGRFVAFDSKANNWPGSTSAVLTYVRDRVAGTTEIVSVSSSEQVANNTFGSGIPAISDNGRYVTYASAGNNLVSGDTNNQPDVFLRDLTAGTTSRVSVSTPGAQANSSSRTPAISGKAKVPVIAFVSGATNLVPGDTNGDNDIYARKTA